MDFIFEIIIMILIEYPGAAVRWMWGKLFKSKKKYKDYLDDYSGINGAAFMGFIVIIVTCYFGIINFL